MLRLLTSARFAVCLVPALILFGYGGLPLLLRVVGVEHRAFDQLTWLSLVGAGAVFIGVIISSHLNKFTRVAIRPDLFLICVWSIFLIYIIAVNITAERIPLIASLQGADGMTISILRERFLKAREGWQVIFVYLNALFCGFLIPYCIALMFLHRFRLRWICFLIFLLYTISFAEKGFFFKAIIPLFYLVVHRRIVSFVRPGLLVAAIVSLLILVTVTSRVGTATSEGSAFSYDSFFSARYVPRSPADYMIWRAAAIPVITAADALAVHDDYFDGRLLWGATSNLIAWAFGLEPIRYERLVFMEQWGQNETGTGSSNSVYLTEAYVNFGMSGVILFSAFIGVIMSLFARSKDYAFQSLWLIFFMNIFYAGLIGTMLSNGFIMILAIATGVRFVSPQAASERCLGAPLNPAKVT